MTHQKCLESQPHEVSNLSTTRAHPLAMFIMHTPSASPVPVRIPSKEDILSPEWTHAITTIMGQLLSSVSGKCIQKWIQYHAIQDPTDFWLYWDPTDPDDIKLLKSADQKCNVLYFLQDDQWYNLTAHDMKTTLSMQEWNTIDLRYFLVHHFQIPHPLHLLHL